VTTPVGNGSHFVTVFTSTGFHNLKVAEYVAAVTSLRPNITIPLADLPHGRSTPSSSKKAVRMSDRTEEWLEEFLLRIRPNEEAQGSSIPDTSVFAPVLPLPYPIQWQYLDRLRDEFFPRVSGLAIYDVDILPDLVDNYKPLLELPRLSLDLPNTPHQILRQISLGVDILSVPFLNTTSDAGVALAFTFPPATSTATAPGQLLPLGVDMWEPDHKTAVTPLQDGCSCYTCTNHHRAFVHHLLNTKEMLGWTLLQIHNHSVMAAFFAGVREALAAEPSRFDEHAMAFAAVYEPEIPFGGGERPRARGYHFKSEAGGQRINRPGWQNIDGVEGEAVAAIPVVGDAAETSLVLETDAANLEEAGLAAVADDAGPDGGVSSR
jgi:queuine tRNA-ribosyltransferase accessory subunit